MSMLTKFENTAAAFIQVYPIGTEVHGDELVEWARNHANGLATDLLIADEGKKLSALRRHINSGASSRNFAESERFYVEITDAKRRSYRVTRLLDHVQVKAATAFGKSARAALAPITSSQRALKDVKMVELTPEERKVCETQMNDLINLQVPLKKIYHEVVVERWVARLEAKGYSRAQALALTEILGSLRAEMKLMTLTSNSVLT